MSIHINQDKSLFHLQTDHTSYIFNVLENGELGQLYYGPRLHDQAAYPNLAAREWRNANAAVSEDQPDLQPGVLKQEYASFGKGDFREPAFQVTLADGSRISEFAVTGYDVTPGKARLGALPSTFASDDDVTSLTIHLTDAWAKLALDLNYAVFPHQDVIVRSATFANQGQESVVLNRALSLQLDLPDSQYDLIQFSGSWARERHLFKNPIHVGTQGISSRRGSSSHQQNPFFLLTRPTTTEDAGAAFGFNLVYSGNFMDQVEVDQYDTTRILTGINPAEFGWTLAPEKQFQTPEAVMSYSHQGTNQLSQQLGDLYAKHLVNQNFAAKERPILVNNWEATQFDFTADKLLAFAQSAKKMGIEMLVLDDGWFGHRDDDTSSLGDWFVNAKKFPQGFKHLSDSVHDLGLKFGLWFEPEMISKDSNLYKTHPDWLIHAPGRTSSPERHQFVLDMTRPEVVAYLYDAMAKMIADNHIDYVKWDMNRNITEMYGAQLAPDQQLEFPHRYILGVYRLYDKLTQPSQMFYLNPVLPGAAALTWA
ncbi:alpha-galactosidase [Agrilactobacillus composti DSM 18527 = JCM 14202]|nr:alpha-galactosidase [Agrilactobacillus composti DSM 18527 = JCM 14202]